MSSITNLISRVVSWVKPNPKVPSPTLGKSHHITAGINPKKFRVIPRSDHKISRANISKNALRVLYRLHEAGFQAYLVGGGVRDLLLNLHPKDFDVATDAHPEEVYRLFRNCRLIGRRFRLAHVYFGYEIIEVATFRGGQSSTEIVAGKANVIHSDEGMILRDNAYGTLEEDAYRRDFTINALYYNIADFAVLDFVGGWQDLENKVLHMIGDAATRYREDPVRILRAIRFAGKLGFSIHPDTEKPIYELGGLLQNASSARLFEEYLKLFLSGHAVAVFYLLRKYHLLNILFPHTEHSLEIDPDGLILRFLEHALISTDKRILEGKSVAPPFLLAALLWHPVLFRRKILLAEGLPDYAAMQESIEEILNDQQKSVAVPKRFTQMIREIWLMQVRLQRRTGRRASQVFSLTRFRAAYDFLLLRAEAGEPDTLELSTWWTAYIAADADKRWEMAASVQEGVPKRKRRKRKPITGGKEA